MAKASDLIGKRYGKLTVVSRSENNHKGNTMWLCKCDCGKEKIALGYDLTHGRTVSCGCNNVGKIAPTRKDLTGMRFGTLTVESISEEKSIRGNLSWNCVCVCDEWLQPGGFERFREWAFENGYNDNLSLDRIDNDGSYSPDNCRWITMKEQQNNRSDNVFLEYNGEIKTMKQWSECLGMKYSLLKSRHYRGWTVPEIFSEPNR